jgi:hypothetical protein
VKLEVRFDSVKLENDKKEKKRGREEMAIVV